MDYQNIAQRLGIETCRDFSPEILVPEERIRALCLENKCQNYGKNYTCPPYVGSLEEITTRLRSFQHALLLQYSKEIDVQVNREGVIRTKMDFHNKVLQMEESMKETGINRIWGLIGGNCGLCDICKVQLSEPCLHPEKARMSLEAIAIDVLALLEQFGLDNEFHADRITWTGCIIF